MRLRPVLPVVAVLAALTLTACDDVDKSVSAGMAGEPATPASTSSADPSPATSTPTAPTTPDSPVPSPRSGTTTAPGAQLTYGDTALVEIYATSSRDARIEYTVTGVELTEGPIGKLARISIDVHAIDDVSGSIAMGIIDWQGLDDLGNPTVLGFAEGCDGELPVTGAGEAGTMCVAVQLTGEGTSLTEVHYRGNDYRDEPIVWEP